MNSGPIENTVTDIFKAMAKKRVKRPRDPVELAKLVGDIATGQVKDEAPGSSGHRAVASGTASRGSANGSHQSSRHL